jgi:Flp pilus assembly protein TadG
LNPQNTLRLKPDALLRRLRRRAGGENGGTLVETGFCLTLLMVFIFGIIEVSWALFSYHYVSEAARDGTRYAIVRGSDWSSTATCDGTEAAGLGYASAKCVATVADVQNYVANLGLGPLAITTSDVCVEYLSTSSSFPSTPTSCTNSTGTLNNAAGDVVEVQVTYPFSFGLPGFPMYTYNLKSISEMVIAQ